jgi:hypothetical protein
MIWLDECESKAPALSGKPQMPDLIDIVKVVLCVIGGMIMLGGILTGLERLRDELAEIDLVTWAAVAFIVLCTIFGLSATGPGNGRDGGREAAYIDATE